MAVVYLIPTFLHEGALHVLPSYILDAVADCQVLFVENERSARRYLKQLKKDIVVDQYEWFIIVRAEEAMRDTFRNKLKEGTNIGIISEAGCPGVADPGQLLVAAAQEMGVKVVPLVGPSSILLALMASGMSGQQFNFVGYLPIEQHQRIKAIKELEAESRKKNCTQIFIETPYRNNQILEALLKHCQPTTQLCVAVNITGSDERIHTRTVAKWKQQVPNLHKQPAIFLLKA